MSRRALLRGTAIAVAATGLAAAVAGAGLSALLGEDVISACRNKSTGVLRVPSAGLSCKGDEQPLQWNVRGPAGATGPQGPPGPVSLSTLAGSGCTTAAGQWGALRVRTDDYGAVTFSCRAADDPYALPRLMLNEIDYDQPGADGGGFVELFNAGRGTADLGGLAIVLVDGDTGSEYLRVSLSGALLAGEYLKVPVEAQNGPADAVALYSTIDTEVLDALSYEGPVHVARIGAYTFDLVEGEGLPPSVADSDTEPGSLARLPNGSDTDDAGRDWAFTRIATPGNPNIAG